jgi:hypothetical protein
MEGLKLHKKMQGIPHLIPVSMVSNLTSFSLIIGGVAISDGNGDFFCDLAMSSLLFNCLP